MSQQGKKLHFDVLVIGSGVAGLTYILKLSQILPETKIALITKKELAESNTQYAQGGIAAVAQEPDTLLQHIDDTLKAGDELSRPEMVKQIIENAPGAIQFLIEQGAQFAQTVEGHYDLGIEGGHSQRRIYHTQDATGHEIVNVLTAKVKKLKNVTIFEYHSAINLITQTVPHTPGSPIEVVGCYVLDEKAEIIYTFLANAVILATGGAGKVFRYTSNPDVATGDGIAMAYRAGARVGNMEFVQFHPTLLYHHQINNFLISEALRGEGAYLRLPHSNERFMQRYDSQAMELATRDVVARAIFTEMENHGYSFVYLDVRHLGSEFINQRFPTIAKTLQDIGLNIDKDMIPVVPAAHYLCGGVLTDVTGQTDLLRLYAIGETAFTGLHGANRLASNSLLEGIVMGQLSAVKTASDIKNPLSLIRKIQNWNSKSVVDLRRASQLNAHWRGLRGEMTSYAGIIRTEAGLKDLLKLIHLRKEIIEEYYWKHSITRDLIELRNIVLVAELIIRSALNRKESRGGHYRADYPQKASHGEDSVLRFAEAFSLEQ